MHRVDRAAGGACGHGGEHGRRCGAEADLLAFHIGRSGKTCVNEGGRGLRFGDIDRRRPDGQQDGHRDHQSARLFLCARQSAERHNAAKGQRIHGDHRNQIGQRRRVLERMGGVCIEEAAAVGANLLDRLLARHGTDGEGLLGALQGRDVDMLDEGLRDALHNQQKRHHERHRQEHVQGDTDHVPPEVADALAAVRRKGASQRADDSDAGRARKEVLDGQPHHLRAVRQGRLARIGLPVRVGDEADRRVEGEIRRKTGQF